MYCIRGSLVFLCVGLTVAASAIRPDTNSFLNKRALSVKELVAQVKRDGQVRDRYKRHFAMSSQGVIAYFSSLRLVGLGHEGVYSIYSVPPGEWIKLHYGKLREGTPVFVDPAGNPVLLMKCGNPLIGGRDVVAEAPPDSDVIERRAEIREIEVLSDEPLSESLVAMTPSNPEPVPAEQIITVGQSPVTILPGAFGFNPLLLGLGGLIIGSTTGGDDTPPPVPEPAGFAAFGVGLIGLFRFRKILTRR